jgi:hypothetical protein
MVDFAAWLTTVCPGNLLAHANFQSMLTRDS